MEEKYAHIHAAVGFADLIRTTLGPRGMNKMVIDQSNNSIVLSNDGATIIGALRGGNPIINLFKELAQSHELAIGDGTTSVIILAGQLLQNALNLLDKGIHPTIIINGYNLSKIEALKFLSQNKETGETKKIIKTAFGTKISKDIIEHLTNLIIGVEDYDKLKIYSMSQSDPFESKLFKGYVFSGFTMNERMKDEITGKVAFIDFPVSLKAEKFAVTNAEELEKISKIDTEYKKKIIDKLGNLGVRWLFYTDTNPEFETYLTDKGITGVVIFQRENFDGICKAVNAVVSSSLEQLTDRHLGEAHIKYEKQLTGNSGHIYIEGNTETLILKAPTNQFLEEMRRAVDDVISLLKHDTDCVIGAGAIEIEIANHLRKISQSVGGKEQLAIEKFAEAIESIPLILAENCGLDAIEVLTALKTVHSQGKTDLGVDMACGISNARERGILEPVLIKIHAINSAANVASLILKLDKILLGQMENNK